MNFVLQRVRLLVIIIYDNRNKINYMRMKKLAFCICILMSGLLSSQNKVNDLIRSGDVNNDAKKYTAAEKDFETAYTMVETELEASLIKLEAFNKLSEYDKAIKENPINAEKSKQYTSILYGRGVAKAGLNQGNAALKDFNRVLMIDSKFVPAYYQRGLIRITSNDKQAGCLDLRTAGEMGYAKAAEAIKNNTCNAESDDFYSKALDKYRREQYKEAIADLDMAIKFNPDTEYYFQRGMCQLKLAHYDDAVSDFSTAIKKVPADKPISRYLLNRGNAYLGLKQYTPAYADLSEAIKLDNNNYEAYKNRGIAAEGLKDMKGASYDYQNLTRIQPSNGEGYYKLAMVKYDMFMKDDACELFNKAKTLGYADAEARVKLCKLRSQSGQKPQ